MLTVNPSSSLGEDDQMKTGEDVQVAPEERITLKRPAYAQFSLLICAKFKSYDLDEEETGH